MVNKVLDTFKVQSLYEELKEYLLNRKDYHYYRLNHFESNNLATSKMKENYYDEEGYAKFKNAKEEVVEIRIKRWHTSKLKDGEYNPFWLNYLPNYEAEITLANKPIWHLELKEDKSFTVTEDKLPIDTLFQDKDLKPICMEALQTFNNRIGQLENSLSVNSLEQVQEESLNLYQEFQAFVESYHYALKENILVFSEVIEKNFEILFNYINTYGTSKSLKRR